MARERKVEALMKGSLHADELMHFVDAPQGLRTARRMSHVVRSGSARLSAAAVHHRYRAQHLSHGGGQARHRPERHRSGARARHWLSPRWRSCRRRKTSRRELTSSFDAAVSCKMADRGQITGGVLDGPLGYDVAISESGGRRARKSCRRSRAMPTSCRAGS